MTERRSRRVLPDRTITMAKPFLDPTATVELLLDSGPPVVVAATALNREFNQQQAAYASEATYDANGVLRGPTGRVRPTNRIRKVHIGHLLVGQPGDSHLPAA